MGQECLAPAVSHLVFVLRHLNMQPYYVAATAPDSGLDVSLTRGDLCHEHAAGGSDGHRPTRSPLLHIDIPCISSFRVEQAKGRPLAGAPFRCIRLLRPRLPAD